MAAKGAWPPFEWWLLMVMIVGGSLSATGIPGVRAYIGAAMVIAYIHRTRE